MKKSTCFWLAQMAVLGATPITADDKLEILKVLMDEEYVQKICEKKAEETKESEVDPY